MFQFLPILDEWIGAPLTSIFRRYKTILLLNVTQLKTKEDLLKAIAKAYKTDEDQEVFIQFFKNGWGVRIELGDVYSDEGEESTSICIDKADGSGYEDPRWQTLFCGTKGYETVNIIRSIRYAYGWTYLFEQLNRFRQTGLREDYPKPLVIYQCVHNHLTDPII